MSNRSPDDLTRSEVKQRNPIGMEYRADQAKHKFPGAPSAGFDCHSTPLRSALVPVENGEGELDMMMTMDHTKWSGFAFFLDHDETFFSFRRAHERPAIGCLRILRAPARQSFKQRSHRHRQDKHGRERSKTRRRISRYPQVDLVFASSRRVKYRVC